MDDEWKIAVSELLLELVQEVHTLSPGIRLNTDITPIVEIVDDAMLAARASGGEDG